MSHYTIDYAEVPQEQKAARAIADIKDYLGVEQFDKTTKALREAIADGCTEDQVLMSLAVFVGVQGLPARVWYAFCGGK